MSCYFYRTKSALKIRCYAVKDRRGNPAAEGDGEAVESMAPREFQDQSE